MKLTTIRPGMPVNPTSKPPAFSRSATGASTYQQAPQQSLLSAGPKDGGLRSPMVMFSLFLASALLPACGFTQRSLDEIYAEAEPECQALGYTDVEKCIADECGNLETIRPWECSGMIPDAMSDIMDEITQPNRPVVWEKPDEWVRGEGLVVNLVEGQRYQLDMEATDADGDMVTLSMLSSPENIPGLLLVEDFFKFSNLGESESVPGAFLGNLLASEVNFQLVPYDLGFADFAFQFGATDSEQSAPTLGDITFHITHLNQPPLINFESFTDQVILGNTASFTLTAIDNDRDSNGQPQPLSIEAVNVPPGATVTVDPSNSNKLIVEYQANQLGTFGFSFQARELDGEQVETEVITLSLSVVEPDAPLLKQPQQDQVFPPRYAFLSWDIGAVMPGKTVMNQELCYGLSAADVDQVACDGSVVTNIPEAMTHQVLGADATACSLAQRGLCENESYFWKVRKAYTDGTFSAWSAVRSFETNDSVIAAYDFDDLANVGLDSSGNTHEAQALDANAATLPTLVSEAGAAGMAILFDGAGDYLEIAEHDDLDSPVSIEMRLKPQGGGGLIDSLDGTDPNGTGFFLFQQAFMGTPPEGNLAWAVNQTTFNHSSSLTRDVWNHLVLTHQENQQTLNIDGVADTTNELGAAITPNDLPVWIGANVNGANVGEFYRGLMDSVVFYNKSLTAEQIKNNQCANEALAGTSPLPDGCND